MNNTAKCNMNIKNKFKKGIMQLLQFVKKKNNYKKIFNNYNKKKNNYKKNFQKEILILKHNNN